MAQNPHLYPPEWADIIAMIGYKIRSHTGEALSITPVERPRWNAWFKMNHVDPELDHVTIEETRTFCTTSLTVGYPLRTCSFRLHLVHQFFDSTGWVSFWVELQCVSNRTQEGSTMEVLGLYPSLEAARQDLRVYLTCYQVYDVVNRAFKGVYGAH